MAVRVGSFWLRDPVDTVSDWWCLFCLWVLAGDAAQRSAVLDAAGPLNDHHFGVPATPNTIENTWPNAFSDRHWFIAVSRVNLQRTAMQDHLLRRCGAV